MNKLFFIAFFVLSNYAFCQDYELVYEPKNGTIELTKSDYDNPVMPIEIDHDHFKEKILKIMDKTTKETVIDYNLDFACDYLEKLNIDNQYTALIVRYIIYYPMSDQGDPVTTRYDLVIYQKDTPVFSYPFTHETHYNMVTGLTVKPQNDYSTGKITKNGSTLNLEIKKPKTNDYIKGVITEKHQVSLVNGKWLGKLISKQ